ncbi:MAG: hypothetical protein JSR58_03840 [Verrucomicrobia bacterium]|nr:hypothetical protein [Verrucomicrobiota bacterium]
MALKTTIAQLKKLLGDIQVNLDRADLKGNKSAAQRVRTGTIKLAKLAKLYRKESMMAEKKRR